MTARVLVVDDDPDYRLLVRLVLGASTAFEVVGEARHGGAAVERAGDCQPDLVLLDLIMPGMDGFAAMARIREVAPSALVVAMSGFSAEELQLASRAGGAVGYLPKTTRARDLVDELLALTGVLGVVEEALVAATHLAADPTSAGAARRFVDETLERWDCGDLLDTVTLLVSELVTNAVVHARSEVDVTVQLKHGSVRVEVLDQGETVPRRRAAGDEATSGRGVEMIELLATAWGVDVLEQGKRIWFEVPSPGAGVGSAA